MSLEESKYPLRDRRIICAQLSARSQEEIIVALRSAKLQSLGGYPLGRALTALLSLKSALKLVCVNLLSDSGAHITHETSLTRSGRNGVEHVKGDRN